jgi:hypothetical protein
MREVTMKELMQKALSAIEARRNAGGNMNRHRRDSKQGEPRPQEDWGMSPEDALRVGTVARYK